MAAPQVLFAHVSQERCCCWFINTTVAPTAGTPPSIQRWAVQLTEWTTCVVFARAIVGTVVRSHHVAACKTCITPNHTQVVLLSPLLVHVASLLDAAFSGQPNALLAFVMVVCPLLMNMVQLLVQDWVLRWRGSALAPARSSDGVWRASMSDTDAEVAELLPRR